MAGIVEVVMDTPCAVCRRLARYTLFHRADELLLARFREPVHHSDVHLIVWELERLHPQVPVGVCACGAVGAETTSAEFQEQACREDLNHVAEDQSYEIARLSLDGETLWESDLEQWRTGLVAARQAHLSAAFEATNDPPGTAYIRAKAELYCRTGSQAYRAGDALANFAQPLSDEVLSTIDLGMRQLAGGEGLAATKPLNIPVESSHSLPRALHFDVVAQMARRSEDGRFILDALLCRHVVDGREAVLFNRVPVQQKDKGT
jgi:hypothetical protein